MIKGRLDFQDPKFDTMVYLIEQYMVEEDTHIKDAEDCWDLINKFRDKTEFSIEDALSELNEEEIDLISFVVKFWLDNCIYTEEIDTSEVKEINNIVNQFNKK